MRLFYTGFDNWTKPSYGNRHLYSTYSKSYTVQFRGLCCARLLNEELNDESLSVDFFRKSLLRLHSELVKNQYTMERLILLLHGFIQGFSLRKTQDGNKLNFEHSLNSP